MTKLTKLGLSAAVAVGMSMPAMADTELTMYYPIAVGGALTEVVDSIVADFEAENPDIVSLSDIGDTYEKSIGKSRPAPTQTMCTNAI